MYMQANSEKKTLREGEREGKQKRIYAGISVCYFFFK